LLHQDVRHFLSKTLPAWTIQTCSLNALGIFCLIIVVFKVYVEKTTYGNPTKCAPIPNPDPVRADAPTDGAYTSRMAKVAIAVSEIIPISLIFSLPEKKYAAKATATPSRAYFTRRVTKSDMSGIIEGADSFLSAILYSTNEEK
jgi:hypothetical protein